MSESRKCSVSVWYVQNESNSSSPTDHHTKRSELEKVTVSVPQVQESPSAESHFLRDLTASLTNN